MISEKKKKKILHQLRYKIESLMYLFYFSETGLFIHLIYPVKDYWPCSPNSSFAAIRKVSNIPGIWISINKLSGRESWLSSAPLSTKPALVKVGGPGAMLRAKMGRLGLPNIMNLPKLGDPRRKDTAGFLISNPKTNTILLWSPPFFIST